MAIGKAEAFRMGGGTAATQRVHESPRSKGPVNRIRTVTPSRHLNRSILIQTNGSGFRGIHKFCSKIPPDSNWHQLCWTSQTNNRNDGRRL